MSLYTHDQLRMRVIPVRTYWVWFCLVLILVFLCVAKSFWFLTWKQTQTVSNFFLLKLPVNIELLGEERYSVKSHHTCENDVWRAAGMLNQQPTQIWADNEQHKRKRSPSWQIKWWKHDSGSQRTKQQWAGGFFSQFAGVHDGEWGNWEAERMGIWLFLTLNV